MPKPCDPNCNVTIADNAHNQACPPRPRLRTIDRSLPTGQTIDDLIPADDQARKIMAIVENELDFQPLEVNIKAVQGVPGRNATPPQLLAALWIYAIMHEVINARKLQRLTRQWDPLKWMCGGVTVNHSMLSAFLRENAQWLEGQFRRLVQIMLAEGLIDFDEPLGQDGMRTRAAAGSSSFRSQERLQTLLQQAIEQAHQTHARIEANQEDLSPTQQAAQLRAADEKVERIAAALEESRQLQTAREAREKGTGKNPRASTTDPQARKMKMADNGYRPAYNTQFATLLNTLVVVGVFVSNVGSDSCQAIPMFDQLQRSYKNVPHEVLLDGNYSTHDNINHLSEIGVTVYSPVKQAAKQLAQGKDPYAPKKGDSQEMQAWRARMGEVQSQTKYQQRSKCELPNAWCRNRGLGQYTVRGLNRVNQQARWFALAYNLQRLMTLREQQTELETSAA